MTASTNGASTRRPSVGPGLESFCQSVVQLARDLPTPVQRLSLHVGEWAVEVEFTTPPSSGTPSPVLTEGGRSPHPAPAEAEKSGIIVRSELVGTFFAAPSPAAGPFVRVGDAVDQGQQLGIVEAMKLMNPVLAPCAGTVLEEHVCDGQSVEYDQPLITLDRTESS